MKRICFLLLATYAVFLGFACDACGEKDVFPCLNKDCGTYGDCDNGECFCDPGAQKDAEGKCTILERDAFVATYNCTVEVLPGGAIPGTTKLYATAGTDGIQHLTLELAGTWTLNGLVDGSTVTLKQGETFGGDTYTGDGTLTGNTLKLTFEQRSGNDTYTWKITGSKQ